MDEMKTCPQCKKVYMPELMPDQHGMEKWLVEDYLIQDAFPNATGTQREQLQTGICSDVCWNQYMGPEL